jgi:hypothetical protein
VDYATTGCDQTPRLPPTHALASPAWRTPALPVACRCPQMVMLKKTKGLTWPFWALALATTLLYLAGLAALQYSCSFIPTVQATPGIFGRSAFGELSAYIARLWLAILRVHVLHLASAPSLHAAPSNRVASSCRMGTSVSRLLRCPGAAVHSLLIDCLPSSSMPPYVRLAQVRLTSNATGCSVFTGSSLPLSWPHCWA